MAGNLRENQRIWCGAEGHAFSLLKLKGTVFYADENGQANDKELETMQAATLYNEQTNLALGHLAQVISKDTKVGFVMTTWRDQIPWSAS